MTEMTASELLERWRERDRRYATHGSALYVGRGERDAVRAWRLRELEELAPEDRSATLVAAADSWTVPTRFGK